MTGTEASAHDDIAVLRMLAGILRGIRAAPTASHDFARGADAIADRLAARARRRRARFEISPREAPPTHLADVALVQRALQGERKAVEEVWNSAQGVAVARIHAMGLGRYEDDLMELVMARVWDKLALYKGTAAASLRTWVWTLAGNALRNWLRDNKSRNARTVRLDGEYGGDATIAAPAPFAADHDMTEADQQARFRHLLDRISRIASERLRPEEWELVLRVVVRGETYDVIAAELGELPGTLRARVFRALQRLRDPLRQELGEEAKEYFSVMSESDR